MSVVVELADLAEAIRGRTGGPYLLSVRNGAPRAMAVAVELVEGGLVVSSGPRTAATVIASPAVTLLWPDDEAHTRDTLLVDGTAEVRDAQIVITPTSAILHRRR